MATSTIAWNKLQSFSAGSIPSGLAYDTHGHPADHPASAASLAPVGDYKGFGLGMMVSILCSLLGEGPIDSEIPPMFRAPLDKRRGISHCFLAVRIASFLPLSSFTLKLQRLALLVRSLPPMEGQQPLIPGDPEKNSVIHRSGTGIPVTKELYKEFIDVSERMEEAFV
jgi:LDH2 family malate/lactate/ureidoglycolate dehydrogenase